MGDRRAQAAVDGGLPAVVRTLNEIATPLPIGISLKSVEEGFVYKFWNRRMERLYQLSAREVVGRRDEEFLGVALASRVRQEDEEAVRRNGRPLYGRVAPTGSTEERYVQRTKFLITDGGRSYVASFVSEVTELVASKRAVETSREWQETMLSVISHDVLTTLTSLEEGLTHLRESWEVLDSATALKTVSLLQGGADRSADLLQDILLWSRSGHAAGQAARVEVELPLLLSEVARKVQIAKAREIRVQAPASLPAVTSAPALKAVVRNLLSNACEHGRGSEIEVRLAQESADRLLLTVHDNGEGLPEGFLRPLNEGRLPQEIEPGRTGRRGIGLKICLTLAEHLGGRLQFANRGGLEVVLSLPRS